MYNNYGAPYYGGYNAPNYGANPYGSPSVQFQPSAPQNGSQQAIAQYSIEYVNGLEGAKAYLIPPNSTKLLMDSDGDYFYIKTANPQGQANVKIYKYEEVLQGSSPKETPTAKNVKYATVEDIELLREEIEKLKLIKPVVRRSE